MLLTLILAAAAAFLPSPPSDMVSIPAGDFWMGRYHMWLIDEIGWQTRDRMDDRPMHLVYLDAFLIDRYEVTNGDYARFVEETRHRAPFHWRKGNVPEEKPRMPVYNVSWDDAAAYCAWARKHLPTEAEWEKAARGGYEKLSHPSSNGLDEEPAEDADEDAKPIRLAHYGHPKGPIDVSYYPPNGYGAYDMVGNVWEWVADGYELYYYSVSPRENPRGPKDAPYKIYRGGSWGDVDERLLSVFYRNFTDPATRTSTIGFRCASDP